MGLFDALKNVVRGKAKEIEESLGDPVRDGKLAIEDASKALVEYKSQIAQVMTQEKKLQRELKSSKEEVKKYDAVAVKAVEAGNDEDALRSLEVKSKNEARATELQGQLKIISGQIKNLREQMDKRRSQIADAERNISQLQARQTCATVREQIAKASEGPGGSSDPFAKLAKLESKVQSQEDAAEALEDLNNTSTGEDDLAEKYAATTSSASDALAAMKAKMAQ